uniref:Poly(ADP-ribose) polymerase 1 n=1 Tax=Myotis myotis TaxID=51298 RepID=A0A7J7RUV8_MYOMY|nr:poly(ADP-ribose) polymerase 1 [Myotis myotis]
MAEASDKLYRVEYAKSGRASCKKCSESIPKDALRMAIMVQSPMFDGKVPHWYHFSCFWKVGHSIWQPDVEVDGFSELRWDDQQKVKKTAEAGGVAGPHTPGRPRLGLPTQSFRGPFPEELRPPFPHVPAENSGLLLSCTCDRLCPAAGRFLFPMLELWSLEVVVLIGFTL